MCGAKLAFWKVLKQQWNAFALKSSFVYWKIWKKLTVIFINVNFLCFVTNYASTQENIIWIFFIRVNIRKWQLGMTTNFTIYACKISVFCYNFITKHRNVEFINCKEGSKLSLANAETDKKRKEKVTLWYYVSLDHVQHAAPPPASIC